MTTTNTTTVRVGQMPGRINEYVVEVGTTLSALIELAELNASGYDVKVDGVAVTNLDQVVTASTNLVVLAKQVKGNIQRSIRVGQMPGRINEYLVDDLASVASVLELAGLSASGYDVKIDGAAVTNLNQVVGGANLIVLAKQVKGNAGFGDVTKSVRVGQMPGRIQEYIVAEGASIASVIELAELSAAGYDVKVDGQAVTDLEGTKVTQSTNLIVLAKQVKGNK
jgi:galactitol-specific phosphotransferase system IIB component